LDRDDRTALASGTGDPAQSVDLDEECGGEPDLTGMRARFA